MKQSWGTVGHSMGKCVTHVYFLLAKPGPVRGHDDTGLLIFKVNLYFHVIALVLKLLKRTHTQASNRQRTPRVEGPGLKSEAAEYSSDSRRHILQSDVQKTSH